MSRTFKVDELAPDGYRIYSDGKFEFDPGVTVLTGCNGVGKTTLMDRMKKELDKLDIPWREHDAVKAKDKLSGWATFSGNRDLVEGALSTMWCSEGESIKAAFSYMVRNLGYFIMTECADNGTEEAWVFMDSFDSGMSVDNVREVMELLDDVMIPTRPEGLELYIVIAANSYEFARCYDCIDVQTARHLSFRSYGDYSAYVMGTRKQKDIWIKEGPVENGEEEEGAGDGYGRADEAEDAIPRPGRLRARDRAR